MKTRIEFEERKLFVAVLRGSLDSLRRAGAYVRAAARKEVSISPTASAPGTPPNSRRGLLQRSILFGIDKNSRTAVIGPAENLIGTAASAHEFGGSYRDRNYPKRPLMGPTLVKVAPHLPKLWEDSVKP